MEPVNCLALTTTLPSERFVALGPQHAAVLAAFDCCPSGSPDWLETIEYGIQGLLARSLELGAVWAVGDFQGDQLRGVIIWCDYSEDARLWEIVILATDRRCRRRGVARGLKNHLLDRAEAKGVLAVVSRVHSENPHMLHLNESLGASIKPDPDDEFGELFFCAVDPLARLRERSEGPKST